MKLVHVAMLGEMCLLSAPSMIGPSYQFGPNRYLSAIFRGPIGRFRDVRITNSTGYVHVNPNYPCLRVM